MTVKSLPRIVSAESHSPLESTPRLAPSTKIIGRSCKMGEKFRCQRPGLGSWLCREPAARGAPTSPAGSGDGPGVCPRGLWEVQKGRYRAMI